MTEDERTACKLLMALGVERRARRRAGNRLPRLPVASR